MKKRKPFFIGVSGGSGSGKSTITNSLSRILGSENILVISQDHYYKDLSHLSVDERVKENFDDPASIDKNLLVAQVKSLLEGESVELPNYDFSVHSRGSKTTRVEPKRFIVLEGIFSLCFSELLPLYDLKLYVDVPDDLRFIRRLERDIKSRGRTLECVTKIYLENVRPMHIKHIEPCRHVADFILPWIHQSEKLVKGIAAYIQS